MLRIELFNTNENQVKTFASKNLFAFLGFISLKVHYFKFILSIKTKKKIFGHAKISIPKITLNIN